MVEIYRENIGRKSGSWAESWRIRFMTINEQIYLAAFNFHKKKPDATSEATEPACSVGRAFFSARSYKFL